LHGGLAVDPPDIDRITELTRRLEKICQEAQCLRAEINAMALAAPAWPDVRKISWVSRNASSASHFSPQGRPPPDPNLIITEHSGTPVRKNNRLGRKPRDDASDPGRCRAERADGTGV
jgi:hypothetical protein